MKTRLLIFAILISNIGLSQEFSILMYFEDALGNRDSLTIGYDAQGSDGIDQIFGENDIISQPLDTLFDVRISNYFWNDFYDWNDEVFQLKKQILANKCGHYFSTTAIEIFCKNWPVTATWNKSSFNTDCLKESVFTSCFPGGWFDVPGPSDLNYAEMKRIDSVVFTSNFNYEYPGLGRVTEDGDTISIFFQAFGHNLIAGNKEFGAKSRLMYPNPTEDFLFMDLDYNSLNSIKAYDLSGKSYSLGLNEGNVNVCELENGLYIIDLEFKDGHSENYKFMKK